ADEFEGDDFRSGNRIKASDHHCIGPIACGFNARLAAEEMQCFGKSCAEVGVPEGYFPNEGVAFSGLPDFLFSLWPCASTPCGMSTTHDHRPFGKVLCSSAV